MELTKDSGSMKELFFIALPMVISFGCDTVMTFTDRLFLSKLGPEYMNAAMAGGITCFVLMTFFVGLLGYITAFVAQSFGSDKKNNCSLALTQGIIISAIAFLVILILKPLLLLIFDKINIEPAQLIFQKQYFNLIIYSVFFSLLRTSFANFFSGIGKTKIVMIASITSMCINIVFDYFFIFGNFGFPKLGVKGAAIATIFASFVGVFILIIAYLKKENILEYKVKESFKIDKHVMKTLLHFGFPSGIEMFLSFLAFNIMVFVFHSQGEITATAVTIMFNWDLVSFVPLLGFSVGVMSLVGRYLGANRIDLVKKSVNSGAKLGICYSIFIFVVFVFFTKYLVLTFSPDGYNEIFEKQITPIALAMIKISSIYVLTDAQMIVFSSALRGAGDTFFAMIASIFTSWIMCTISFLIIKVFGLSVIVAWSVITLTFSTLSLIFYLRYKSEKWVLINREI